MIVVKTVDGEIKKIPTASHYDFSRFNRYLRLYTYAGRNIAVFKTSEIVGFWEE